MNELTKISITLDKIYDLMKENARPRANGQAGEFNPEQPLRPYRPQQPSGPVARRGGR